MMMTAPRKRSHSAVSGGAAAERDAKKARGTGAKKATGIGGASETKGTGATKSQSTTVTVERHAEKAIGTGATKMTGAGVLEVKGTGATKTKGDGASEAKEALGVHPTGYRATKGQWSRRERALFLKFYHPIMTVEGWQRNFEAIGRAVGRLTTQVHSHAQKRFKTDMKHLEPPSQRQQAKESIPVPATCRPAAFVFLWNAVNMGGGRARKDSSKA